MIELQFHINKKAFTFDDLIGLDEGNLRTFKAVMAKCLVDPSTGKVFEDSEVAGAILGNLDLEVTELAGGGR